MSDGTMCNPSKVAPAMSSNAEAVASESGYGLPRGLCTRTTQVQAYTAPSALSGRFLGVSGYVMRKIQ